jgi:hypothetical protein
MTVHEAAALRRYWQADHKVAPDDIQRAFAERELAFDRAARVLHQLQQGPWPRP